MKRNLTETEQKVYNTIVIDKCLKRKDIAEKMGLTVNAISFHLTNIYTKLLLKRNSVANILIDYEERQKNG